MTELRQLPDGWQWVQLGIICDTVIGRTPSRSVPEYWKGDLNWVSIGDLTADVIYRTREQITSLGAKASGSRLIPAGALLFSFKLSIGKMAFAGTDLYTNEAIAALVPKHPQQLDSKYLRYALAVADLTTGTSRAVKGFTFNLETLRTIPIALPPNLIEQQRIASRIEAHMAEIAAAHAAAEAELAAAEELAAAYLREVFESDEAKNWNWENLGDYTDFLAAGSIATEGDTEVQAITTACLTETGFNPKGVKSARMWAKDAVACAVGAGEVLIARSNTPELVGRVSMYSGEPKGIVASDLTIRIGMRNGLMPEFLTAYLSFLFLTGYWKDRAGGASGTMKKITRTQLLAESIPVPRKEVQERYVSRVREHMSIAYQVKLSLKEQLYQVNDLQRAVLEQAFNGEL